MISGSLTEYEKSPAKREWVAKRETVWIQAITMGKGDCSAGAPTPVGRTTSTSASVRLNTDELYEQNPTLVLVRGPEV